MRHFTAQGSPGDARLRPGRQLGGRQEQRLHQEVSLVSGEGLGSVSLMWPQEVHRQRRPLRRQRDQLQRVQQERPQEQRRGGRGPRRR